MQNNNPVALPQILDNLGWSEGIMAIKQYQDICHKCWDNIKSLRGVFELKALKEFLEIVFDQSMMEIFLGMK